MAMRALSIYPQPKIPCVQGICREFSQKRALRVRYPQKLLCIFSGLEAKFSTPWSREFLLGAGIFRVEQNLREIAIRTAKTRGAHTKPSGVPGSFSPRESRCAPQTKSITPEQASSLRPARLTWINVPFRPFSMGSWEIDAEFL
jgi:hypothetical protein